jgi:hypothetical protein
MSKKKKIPKVHLMIFTETVKTLPATIPIDYKIVEGKPVWGISKEARKAMGISKKDERMMLESLRLNWKNKAKKKTKKDPPPDMDWPA